MDVSSGTLLLGNEEYLEVLEHAVRQSTDGSKPNGCFRIRAGARCDQTKVFVRWEGRMFTFGQSERRLGEMSKRGREGLIGENQGWLKSGILTPGLRFEA